MDNSVIINSTKPRRTSGARELRRWNSSSTRRSTNAYQQRLTVFWRTLVTSCQLMKSTWSLQWRKWWKTFTRRSNHQQALADRLRRAEWRTLVQQGHQTLWHWSHTTLRIQESIHHRRTWSRKEGQTFVQIMSFSRKIKSQSQHGEDAKLLYHDCSSILFFNTQCDLAGPFQAY